MSIQRRATADGETRWLVRLRGPDGRVVNKTFRTKRDAERYERETLLRRDRGQWIDPGSGRVTLNEWAENWQRTTVGLRASTRAIYTNALRNHILPDLGAVPLSRIDAPMLRAWLAELLVKESRGVTLSTATVHRVYRVLSVVLRSAARDGMILRSPLVDVRAPKIEQEPMRFLEAGEVADLAEAVHERYRALVLVGAYCGLRIGELSALRWHRVDLLRRTVSVVEQLDRNASELGYVLRAPKSKAGIRSVVMPRLVSDALDLHARSGFGQPGRDGFVFTMPDGGPLDVNNWRRRHWQPAVKAAGLEPLRIHDLRHTAASLSISAGADVKVVQRLLGHTSAAMTLDRYGHLLPSAAEAVADRLDVLAANAVRSKLAEVVDLPRAGRAHGD